MLKEHGAQSSLRTDDLQIKRDFDLIASVRKGDLAEVRRLLCEGSSANAIDADGRTVLMEAVPFGNPAIVKALLDAGADTRAREEERGWPDDYTNSPSSNRRERD